MCFLPSPLFPFLSPHGGSLPSHTSTHVDSHTHVLHEEGRRWRKRSLLRLITQGGFFGLTRRRRRRRRAFTSLPKLKKIRRRGVTQDDLRRANKTSSSFDFVFERKTPYDFSSWEKGGSAALSFCPVASSAPMNTTSTRKESLSFSNLPQPP